MEHTHTHTHKHKRICNSWYHQTWFRILLLLVALDMLLLGVALVVNFDIVRLLSQTPVLAKIVIGVLYIMISLWMIVTVVSYQKHKKRTYLLCRHCIHQHVHTENTSS